MSKKIIDEKGRIFGKVSIIDIIVLLLAIVVVCGVFVKHAESSHTQSILTDTDKITYQIKVKSVRSGTVDSFREGDKIFDDEKDVEIGTIKKVEVTDSTTSNTNSEGIYVESKIPEKYDVTLTVEAEAQESNGRINVAKTCEIGVNGTKTFYTKYAASQGIITDIQTGK